MTDEQPKPESWRAKHPIVGTIIGTLDEISQHRAMIDTMTTEFEALEARVKRIEDGLSKKRKKVVKPDVLKE